MLGHEIVNPPKTSSKTLSSIENSIQKDINKVASDVAKELNIHDFYSVHILDFCEVGFKLPLFRSSKMQRSLTLTSPLQTGLLYTLAYRQPNLHSG